MPGLCGLFEIGCRFNDSCAPNVAYTYNQILGEMVFTTCRPVREGEQLLISYGVSGLALLESYGFACDCGVCSALLPDKPVVEPWQAESQAGPDLLEGSQAQFEGWEGTAGEGDEAKWAADAVSRRPSQVGSSPSGWDVDEVVVMDSIKPRVPCWVARHARRLWQLVRNQP
jgi:hypothetical protein